MLPVGGMFLFVQAIEATGMTGPLVGALVAALPAAAFAVFAARWLSGHLFGQPGGGGGLFAHGAGGIGELRGERAETLGHFAGDVAEFVAQFLEGAVGFARGLGLHAPEILEGAARVGLGFAGDLLRNEAGALLGFFDTASSTDRTDPPPSSGERA